MICHFTGQGCQYVNCPSWDEDHQACLWRLALLRVLDLPAALLGHQPPLNDTELRILELISLGRQNSQIAEDLGISLKSVSRYVNDILTKLDARTRPHAVMMGILRGIIKPPQEQI